MTGKRTLLPGLRRRIGALSSLKDCLSVRGRHHLANALLISRLSYLICIWSNTFAHMTNKVQVVQNTAARFVTGMNKRTKQTVLVTECRWLNIDELEGMAAYGRLLLAPAEGWWPLAAWRAFCQKKII